jgi:uncharacterized membrane protein YGL010W
MFECLSLLGIAVFTLINSVGAILICWLINIIGDKYYDGI